MAMLTYTIVMVIRLSEENYITTVSDYGVIGLDNHIKFVVGRVHTVVPLQQEEHSTKKNGKVKMLAMHSNCVQHTYRQHEDTTTQDTYTTPQYTQYTTIHI